MRQRKGKTVDLAKVPDGTLSCTMSMTRILQYILLMFIKLYLLYKITNKRILVRLDCIGFSLLKYVCDMHKFYLHWVLDLCHFENISIFLNIFSNS